MRDVPFSTLSEHAKRTWRSPQCSDDDDDEDDDTNGLTFVDNLLCPALRVLSVSHSLLQSSQRPRAAPFISSFYK